MTIVTINDYKNTKKSISTDSNIISTIYFYCIYYIGWFYSIFIQSRLSSLPTSPISYQVYDKIKTKHHSSDARVLFDTGNEGLTLVSRHFYDKALSNTHKVNSTLMQYGFGGSDDIYVLDKPLIIYLTPTITTEIKVAITNIPNVVDIIVGLADMRLLKAKYYFDLVI